MPTNLTKHKTTKTKIIRKPTVDKTETVNLINAALKPNSAQILKATIGKDAAKIATQTKSVTKKGATLIEDMATGSSLLLSNITRARALAKNRITHETTVMTHDELGVFHLRAVEYDGGYLIGVIDKNGATYCECEFFPTLTDCGIGWSEWLEAVQD